MKTYYMHQIVWNQYRVRIPELSHPVGTHHLMTIVEGDDEVQQEGSRTALLAYSRTKEPLCRIIVERSSERDFQAFQNVLLTSRLEY